ncbi:MAG: DISARM system phospholipase D-like protein DrmC [Actinomycetota bacterium]|nr:DISARM system phospholipase D-like protein DrmC [Actinomycetota bacterium]
MPSGTDDTDGASHIEELVAALAQRLPAFDLDRLSRAAAAGPSGLAELRAVAPSPLLRDACVALTQAWKRRIRPEALWVSGLVAGAAAASRRDGQRGGIDVVWTGPDSGVDTARLTAPTIAELIGSAREEIWLVSFASRDDECILAALAAAVTRAVAITVVLERNVDNPHYTATADAYTGLDIRRLAWPASQRPPGAALHAKLIVVDRTTALVGSANLTGRAMTDNLECGVLLRGGPEPATIAAHLESLTRQGVLRPA